MTAALIGVAVGSGGLAIASATFAKASGSAHAAVVQCRINFQASSLRLPVGKDLILTWTAVGADKLTASWTTGYVPFVGTVMTTMNRPGSFSYQVTGTLAGQYCGSAAVNVAFTGTPISHAATGSHPAGTATSGAGQGTTGGGGAGASSGGAANGGGGGNGLAGTAAARNGHSRYPAQSPTGGSGVPWYRQPIYLLAISILAALGSLILWRREHLRAAIVHAH